MSNALVCSQVGLINLLWRHYSWPAMAEARKVLGGAGPAIAAMPASIIWAGISIVDLARDAATKRVQASTVVPRLGFYSLTAAGQVRALRLAHRAAWLSRCLVSKCVLLDTLLCQPKMWCFIPSN